MQQIQPLLLKTFYVLRVHDVKLICLKNPRKSSEEEEISPKLQFFPVIFGRADYHSLTLWTAEQCENSLGSPAPGCCLAGAWAVQHPAFATVEIPASKPGWYLSQKSLWERSQGFAVRW